MWPEPNIGNEEVVPDGVDTLEICPGSSAGGNGTEKSVRIGSGARDSGGGVNCTGL